MKVAPTTRTRAVVLSRVNYGEADRIMQLITPDLGKIGVIARGVRREKSKLAGGIELLAVSDVTLHQGKGDLATLTSARLEQFYSYILNDYDRLQLAYLVLKDVSKATEQVSEPAFFELVVTLLTSLNNPAIDRRVSELWYRLQIAILLGVGINLATDNHGMKLVEGAEYQFDTTEMTFVYNEHGGVYTSDHIKLLRVASAQPPQIIAQIQMVDQLIETCLVIGRIAHES